MGTFIPSKCIFFGLIAGLLLIGGGLIVLLSLMHGIYEPEELINILFIQTFMTFVFLFSILEKHTLFLKTSSWWCVISPISMLLTSAVNKVPLFRNQIPVAVIGILASIVGYMSNFVDIPIIQMFDIVLTIMGALLTVLSLGSRGVVVEPVSSSK